MTGLDMTGRGNALLGAVLTKNIIGLG